MFKGAFFLPIVKNSIAVPDWIVVDGAGKLLEKGIQKKPLAGLQYFGLGLPFNESWVAGSMDCRSGAW